MIVYSDGSLGDMIKATYLLGDDEAALDAKAQQLGFSAEESKRQLNGIPLYSLTPEQKQIAVGDGIAEASEADLQAIRDAWS